MPTQRSSASLRYLKARLQVLKRPKVWGSALVLLLPLFFLADYWKQPGKYAAGINQSPETVRSIPAPVSGSTSPLSDGSRISIPNASDLEAQSSSVPSASRWQIDPLTALLTSPSPDAEQEASEQKPTLRNRRTPLSPRSSNLPKVDLSDAFNSGASPTTAQASGPTGSEENSSSANRAAASQIQAALDRIAGQPAAGNQGNQENIQPGSQTGATAQTAPNPYGQFGSSSSTPAASQSFSQPSGFQPYTPQTSPSPGTTGYTVPPAFRTTTNNSSSPSFGPSPSSSGFRSVPQIGPTAPTQPMNRSGSYGNTPGYSSQIPSYPSPTYTNPQSQVEPAPFSVPRTPPGRYIGGGEVNTFSNP
jgi:hypothetical protein